MKVLLGVTIKNNLMDFRNKKDLKNTINGKGNYIFKITYNMENNKFKFVFMTEFGRKVGATYFLHFEFPTINISEHHQVKFLPNQSEYELFDIDYDTFIQGMEEEINKEKTFDINLQVAVIKKMSSKEVFAGVIDEVKTKL